MNKISLNYYPGSFCVKYHLIIMISIISLFASCKKFVEVDPPDTAISAKLIFKNDVMANAAVTGIFSKMNGTSGGFVTGTNSLTLFCGLSADELLNHSSTNVEQIEFFNNQLRSTNSNLQNIWGELYNYIYTANVVIEGLHASSGLTESLKRRLEGESLFIRAFCNFYLVNLFEDIPLVLSSDYMINKSLPKSSVNQIYASMISDLENAKRLLDVDYINNQRIRPNKSVVSAFLARVYLYNEEWAKAELEASEVIRNPNYHLEDNLNSVFLINSAEAIWQLQSVVPRYNTFDGRYFVLTSTPTNVSLRSSFVDKIASDDERGRNWIGHVNSSAGTYYYPFKYKVRLLDIGGSPTEYLMVLRLSEQYLIRSEARAMQNKIKDSSNDLNIIRVRAGLGATKANDKLSLLLAVENERKIEFFAEWGHRWFDLKRTHRIDPVLGKIKDNWNPLSSVFPIPLTETQRNPNL